MINETNFAQFLKSGNSLEIWHNEKIIFTSSKDLLLPLLEYLASGTTVSGTTIFDKVIGNAAALLAVKAGCREVWSPLGSQPAIKTLTQYKIQFHFTDVVPFILRADGKDLCPMEKLSIGKTPEEFFSLLKQGNR